MHWIFPNEPHFKQNPPVFCFFVAPTHSDINNLHCNAKMQQSWGEYLVSLQQFDGYYMFVLKTNTPADLFLWLYFFYHVKIMLFSLCSHRMRTNSKSTICKQNLSQLSKLRNSIQGWWTSSSLSCLCSTMGKLDNKAAGNPECS